MPINNTGQNRLAQSYVVEVEREQLDQLFQGIPVSIIANMLGGLLLVWAFWTITPQHLLTWWLVGMVVIGGLRMALLSAWKVYPGWFTVATWRALFILLTCLTGVLWLAITFPLFQVQQLSLQLLVAYIMLGLSAGAVTSLSYIRKAAFAYIAPLMLSLIYHFTQMEGMASEVVVLAVIFFSIGLTLSSQRIYRKNLEQLFLLSRYQEQEKKLAAQEHRYRTMLDTAADAFFLHDDQGRFLDVNQQACASLGYSREELLSLSVADIEMMASKSSDDAIWHNLAAGKMVTLQGLHKRKNGTVFPVEIRMGIIHDDKKLISVLVRDITLRKQTELALKESEKNFRSIFEFSPMGIFIYELQNNEQLILHDANPATDKILGIECSQLLGKTIEQAFPSLQGTEIPQKYRDVAQQGNAWSTEEIEYIDNRIAGAYEVFAFRTLPGRVVVMFNDITHRKEVERLKNEFVATVSHELRTPLTSIKGSIDILLGKDDIAVDKKNTLLGIAEKNVRRLLQLINELLDMQRIEANYLELVMSATDVHAVVMQTIELNGTYAHEHQVQIHLECNTPVPEVWADANRLGQVLSNLLSNAVKFSEKNGEVFIRICNNVEGNVEVVFEDYGKGVTEDFEPYLFRKFSQYDSTNTRAVGGTGLGLAISKSLVDKMGGEIGYRRTEHSGASFYIRLPILRHEEKC